MSRLRMNPSHWGFKVTFNSPGLITSLSVGSSAERWPPFRLWTGVFCSISSADDGLVIPMCLGPHNLVRYSRLHHGQWGQRLVRRGFSIHLTTPCDRIPKIMLNCTPNGRRRLERPVKRPLHEAETGLSRSNWWLMIMVRMNGAIPSIPCTLSQHAETP